MPYRLDRRNHTRLLWVFEGITSYYQERFLLVSGLLGIDAYLRRVAESMTRVYRAPGRHRQSLESSSFNAWDRLYKPEPNSPNQDVSYYSKGALVALALDLTLRRASPLRATLDDIVLELWRRFGSQGIGLPEDGFETLAVELGGAGIGDFLSAAIRGTGDPDLQSLFADFGLNFRLRPSEGAQDTGGTPPKLETSRLALGAAFEGSGAGLKLLAVYDGQPAESAGLAPGDIIVAVNRIQASIGSIGECLARYEAGDEVEISFFRGDDLRETRLRLEPAPADTCYVEVDPSAGPAALTRRQAWLGDA
jgi:predicted metalloprotease with PDZ domain